MNYARRVANSLQIVPWQRLLRTGRSNENSESEPVLELPLPVVAGEQVAAEIAAAPVVGWFGALAEWGGEPRRLAGGSPARLTSAQAAQAAAVLGMDTGDALLAEATARWAVQARVLRVYRGALSTPRAGAGVEALDEPAVLWWRAFNALRRPDYAFTDLLTEHFGARLALFDPLRSLEELLAQVACGVMPGGIDHADVRVLVYFANALGLIHADAEGCAVAGDGSGSLWRVTGVGRLVLALARLPYAETDGTERLIGPPALSPATGFTVKVALTGPRVWRRLRLPGDLTLGELHDVIQVAFGWDDDHLHTFSAGPFQFADPSHGLDAVIASDLVTLDDLAVIGVRLLKYRYDLGDCWDHEIRWEAATLAGDGPAIACLGGSGTTPDEDGGDWYEDETGTSAVPSEPKRVYDRGRIDQALARLIGQ